MLHPDICADMRVDIRVNIRVDMRVNMRVDIRSDIYIRVECTLAPLARILARERESSANFFAHSRLSARQRRC